MSDLDSTPPAADLSSHSSKKETRESPWAVPRSLAPDPALLERTGFRTPDSKYDCVLLGPVGTGKSTLLASMGRACRGDVGDGLDLSLVPGRAMAELAGKASLAIGETARTLVDTDEPLAYDFQVAEQEVVVQDWPGHLLFGARGTGSPPLSRPPGLQSWLRGAQEASCLVLCIDSMNPEPRLWGAVLPWLLDDLSVSSGRLLPRLSRIGQQRLPPILSPKRQLPFQRVLVLLTKIDRLCAAAAASVLAEDLVQEGPISPFLSRLAREPRELAQHLDPMRLVEDRLWRGVLGQLRAAAPGALVAAGLTSAWGLEGAVSTPSKGRTRTSTWSPFGVRETVLFLTTGAARNPVELIPPTNPEERFLEFGGRG
jgi:hypothetical protein